jgi:hypothetical protein
MANTIEINNGFDDVSFNEEFLSNSIIDVLGRFGNTIQTDLRKSLDDGGHNASSRLNQSIQFKVDFFGEDGYTFQLSMADYYDYLDKGRAAGKEPPLAPILQWVKLKSVFGGMPEKNQKSMAFAIKKKISKFGTQPTYWFTKVVEDGRLNELSKELSNSIGKNIILKKWQ